MSHSKTIIGLVLNLTLLLAENLKVDKILFYKNVDWPIYKLFLSSYASLSPSSLHRP